MFVGRQLSMYQQTGEIDRWDKFMFILFKKCEKCWLKRIITFFWSYVMRFSYLTIKHLWRETIQRIIYFLGYRLIICRAKSVFFSTCLCTSRKYTSVDTWQCRNQHLPENADKMKTTLWQNPNNPQTDKENYIDFRLRLLGEPGDLHHLNNLSETEKC